MGNTDQKARKILIGLGRQIFVRDPGRDDVATITTGGSMQLWHTRGGLRRIRNLAQMLILEDPDFGHLDLESLEKLIQKIVWDLSDSHEMFSVMSAARGEARTLFDARKVRDEHDFSFGVWFILKSEILRRVTDWLVLYPLPSTESRTFSPDNSTLTILETEDTSSWSELSSRFPTASSWNPRRDNVKRDYFNSEKQYGAWAVTIASGLVDSAARVAERRFRELIAVIISMSQSKSPHPFIKTIGEASRYCILFPADPKRTAIGCMHQPVGPLIPWPGNKIKISSELVADISGWYARAGRLDEHMRRRLSNAAAFMNLGIQQRGIPQFILYFMTLDALFGERNRVEEAIQDGVARSVTVDPFTREKVKLLFDLRSELVHGGIHRIEEWKSLNHYWNHLRSEPIHDIGKLAMECFVKFDKG